jgi:hypothetical protein
VLRYAITQRTLFSGDDYLQQAALVRQTTRWADEGIDFIQLREKDLTPFDLILLTRHCCPWSPPHLSPRPTHPDPNPPPLHPCRPAGSDHHHLLPHLSRHRTSPNRASHRNSLCSRLRKVHLRPSHHPRDWPGPPPRSLHSSIPHPGVRSRRSHPRKCSSMHSRRSRRNSWNSPLPQPSAAPIKKQTAHTQPSAYPYLPAFRIRAHPPKAHKAKAPEPHLAADTPSTVPDGAPSD